MTSPRVGREYIDLKLNAVRVTPPVSHMAVALIPTFGRLYGTLHAFCATDHDGLLKAPGRVTVEAGRFLKKLTRYRVIGVNPCNVATIGVPRRYGFDLAQLQHHKSVLEDGGCPSWTAFKNDAHTRLNTSRIGSRLRTTCA